MYLKQTYKTSLNRSPQRGAVAIEAAIVTFLYMFLIGVVIYFSIYFFRYQLLHDAISSTMRTISTECNMPAYEVGPLVTTKIQTFLTENYGIEDSTLIVPEASVCHLTGTSQCMIRAQAYWNAPCLFCNLIVAFDELLFVGAKVAIEDPCFYSNPEGCEWVRTNGAACY